MKKDAVFLRCRNCGRIIKAVEAHRTYYCSEECSRKFRRCITCGGYFHVQGETDTDFCSEECELSWHAPLKDLPYIHHEEEKTLI